MRILIIEDNEEIRAFMKSGLEAEMFSVDTAHDGQSGSYIARTNDYDLIVLDNMLPKKSGIEVCREIRKAGKHTPVLLVSAKGETEEKVRLLTAGADDYITKPFSFKEFLARVQAVLRRPQQTVPENLTVADLELNSRTHKVRRGRKDIYLTKKEFSLLELLARHSGEVVSRGHILEHVWDFDGNPFSNTIETHIFNLRRKIEHGRNRLIWNIPGRGYKLGVVA